MDLSKLKALQSATKEAAAKAEQEKRQAEIRSSEPQYDYEQFPGELKRVDLPPKPVAEFKPVMVLPTEFALRLIMNRRESVLNINTDPYLHTFMPCDVEFAAFIRAHDPNDRFVHVELDGEIDYPATSSKPQLPRIWVVTEWRYYYERCNARKQRADAERKAINRVSELKLELELIVVAQVKEKLKFDHESATVTVKSWLNSKNEMMLQMYGGVDKLLDLREAEAEKAEILKKHGGS